MTAYQILGILSPCIAALGYIPYIYSMHKGKVKPHPFSWLPWSVIGLVTLVTYVGVGAHDTLPIAVLNFVGPTFIFFVTLKFRYKDSTPFDYQCLYASLAAIIVYVIFRNAAFALSVNLFGDLIAHLPTIRKAYFDPESENLTTWLFFFFGGLLSVLAISSWNYGIAVFPVFITSAAFVVCLSIVLGRVRKKIPR